ncbi:MAG: hypothetical protein GTO22_00200 [Gemmatimonadales bacterium]|nr:hypothetical protein [Gemmatimonadales bacterium]
MATVADVPVDFSSALADRYSSERHLAEGDVITVFLVEGSRNDRTVAVKDLRTERTAAARDRGEAQG